MELRLKPPTVLGAMFSYSLKFKDEDIIRTGHIYTISGILKVLKKAQIS